MIPLRIKTYAITMPLCKILKRADDDREGENPSVVCAGLIWETNGLNFSHIVSLKLRVQAPLKELSKAGWAGLV